MYVQEVLVNPLGGLSVPKKSVVRLNDPPNMTIDAYCGCKTITTNSYNNKQQFQTRQPALMLCLKYSVLVLSGTKQPADIDLR